jgi:geranylgeranyl pyrophosphate synthase
MSARATATALFGPVQADMALVEETLRSAQQVEFPPLARMLEHVLGAGGKRIRPGIALLAGRFRRYDLGMLVPLAASIELLHSATLVHDDVIDGATTRRGRATANSLIDNAASVMVGDFMFAQAAELIARTGSVEVIRLFARTLMAMASGELRQDMNAYDYGQSTMEYFARISGKTASLFATAAQGGAMIAGLERDDVEALRAYGDNLGMAFQVVDDILDFTGDEAEMGKPVGSDLMQGTLTLPALLLMERYPRNNPVRRYFASRRRRDELQRAIDMVRKSDILDESYRVALNFREQAIGALAALPDGETKDALIELADWVTARRF